MAPNMALLHRNESKELLCHLDQVGQYVSGDYRAALAKVGLIASMIRKGNC